MIETTRRKEKNLPSKQPKQILKECMYNIKKILYWRTTPMIAALFAERNSPEKSSALSAVKPQRGCNLYYTCKQFHTTCRILTLTSKLKLFFLLMT